MSERTIAKILSKNDTGETGGHQAGILVPKDEELLSFFPKLDAKKYNPRCHLSFIDNNECSWEFAFIYYNNRLFSGTRNEFRLTRMTAYLRQARLVAGDELVLTRKAGRYRIAHKRAKQATVDQTGILKLGSGWRVVKF